MLSTEQALQELDAMTAELDAIHADYEARQVKEYTHFCSGIFHDAQFVVTYSEVGAGSYAIFLTDPRADKPFMYLGAVTDNLLFLPSAELPVDRVFSNTSTAICYLLSIYGVEYLGSI